MQCPCCFEFIVEGSLKCSRCGEFLKWWHWRALVAWSALPALAIAVLSLVVAFISLDIARRDFGLRYFAKLQLEPVHLSANFEAKGEDESQVWTTVFLKAKNLGTLPIKAVDLKYRIGGPCRNYFSNETIDAQTGTKSIPFDLDPSEELYVAVTFTDARSCVAAYLQHKNYLEVALEAQYRPADSIAASYSSSWRSVGNRFAELKRLGGGRMSSDQPVAPSAGGM